MSLRLRDESVLKPGEIELTRKGRGFPPLRIPGNQKGKWLAQDGRDHSSRASSLLTAVVREVHGFASSRRLGDRMGLNRGPVKEEQMRFKLRLFRAIKEKAGLGSRPAARLVATVLAGLRDGSVPLGSASELPPEWVSRILRDAESLRRAIGRKKKKPKKGGTNRGG